MKQHVHRPPLESDEWCEFCKPQPAVPKAYGSPAVSVAFSSADFTTEVPPGYRVYTTTGELPTRRRR